MKQKVLNGIDRIETVDFVLKGQRLGLITNPSGVRKNLTPTYRYLYEHYKLTALFAPEHGILGNTEAGGAVDHMTETETGLPVYSLYGKIKAPDAKMFSQIDVLCFDIQDVGARFYTYLYTMTRSMAAAAAAGKPFVVFDRINPVSLSAVEGEILEESYASFVGEYAVPVRYGMTVGEFARYINETRKIGAELYIAPCQGLTRKLYFDDTDLLFIPPSPNIPTVQTALAYLGTCFFESVENISEGRGTANPFEQIGAPYINAHHLAEQMNRKGLEGVLFRAACFTPSCSKFAGEACKGVMLHVRDRSVFSPFACGISLFETIRELYDVKIRELPNKRLFGTDRLYAGVPAETIIKEAKAACAIFRKQTQDYYLYD